MSFYLSSTSTPPTIPGSVNLSTAKIDTAHITNLIGPIMSTLNSWKGSVTVATTASITLSATQTIDAVPLLVGDTVLVKDQGDATNGIYIVQAGAWTRRTDMIVGSSAAGDAVFVNEGSANVDKAFVCTNNDTADIVGTSTLVFATLAAAPTTSGAIDTIQVSDGAGSIVSSAATATVLGLVTAATGLVVTTGGALVSAGDVTATSGDIVVSTITRGLTLTATKPAIAIANWAVAAAVLEARQGLITVTDSDLAADTVATIVVTCAFAAADSLIFINATSNANSSPLAIEVSAINPGTSFTIRAISALALNGTALTTIGFAIM